MVASENRISMYLYGYPYMEYLLFLSQIAANWIARSPLFLVTKHRLYVLCQERLYSTIKQEHPGTRLDRTKNYLFLKFVLNLDRQPRWKKVVEKLSQTIFIQNKRKKCQLTTFSVLISECRMLFECLCTVTKYKSTRNFT